MVERERTWEGGISYGKGIRKEGGSCDVFVRIRRRIDGSGLEKFGLDWGR